LSSRKLIELKKVQKECLLYTRQCIVIPLDLAKSKDYQSHVNEIVQKYATIDYLLLNGGVSQRSLAYETPIEIDRKLMEVNYFGNIALAKAVLPQMVRQQNGHIVVVSSIVGKFGFPLRSAYAASKHALHGYFETLRAEHKKDSIKITIVVPGRVKTNISVNALNKEGKLHGEMDQGQEKGISAVSCSKQIIKAIKNNKKEQLIGGNELLMVKIRKYLPFLFYRIVSKVETK